MVGVVATILLAATTTTTSSYHNCHAFLQPQHHQIIQTTRQPHVSPQLELNTVGTTHPRNRFWGNRNCGLDDVSLHRRHSSISRSTRNASPAVMVFSGPSILDRPTTTEEPAVVKEEERVADRRQQQERYNETWEVRLYNDGLNTREHVSRSLVQVTGLSEYQAYQTMMQAHQNGMAVVGQYYYEIAEMFHDALKLEGIICDIIPVE